MPTPMSGILCRITTILAGVSLAAGLTACSGSTVAHVASAGSAPPATAPGTDAVRQAQRYVDCMRHNGVAMLDQLSPEGMPQIDKVRAVKERVAAAAERCRQFLPVEERGSGPSPEDVEKMRRYAACLRRHGLPEYPDPDPDTGEPALSDELAARLKADPHLPAAMRACQALTPGTGPGVVGG